MYISVVCIIILYNIMYTYIYINYYTDLLPKYTIITTLGVIG